MDALQPVAFACIAVIASVSVVRWYTNPLRAIPTVGGSSFPGLAYIAALRNFNDVRAVLEEGYRKHPESAFKVSMFDQWLVIVSGRDTVEDIGKRPDEELSFRLGFHETVQWEYTCDPSTLYDDWQADIVKEKLARTLPTVLPDVVDEVAQAVRDHISAEGDEWTSVELLPALQKIVGRTSNRVFVGLPLCRNEEYLNLAVDFAVHSMIAAFVLRGLVPGFMRAIVAPFISNVKNVINRAVPHVRPILEDRRKALTEPSDHERNDLLQFLPGGETAFVTTQRLLILNFSAIHNTSMAITQVLYHLAEDPALLPPLREEIRKAVSSDGWTSAALGKMRKLDSVLRETLRFHGVSLLLMWRKAMTDVTLRDGTRIPRGTLVGVNAHALHHDDAMLENAGKFDPFRYERMRGGAEGRGAGGGEEETHCFASTSPECISFGFGNHACPGRYFASAELKIILGHIVLDYDMKVGGDGSRPPDAYWATNVLPAMRGRVLFKRREPTG